MAPTAGSPICIATGAWMQPTGEEARAVAAGANTSITFYQIETAQPGANA